MTNSVEYRHRFSLDKITSYQIIVPGKVSVDWSNSINKINVSTKQISSDIWVSRIFGKFDQAGLHGFLRYLYSRGLFIISINIKKGIKQ